MMNAITAAIYKTATNANPIPKRQLRDAGPPFGSVNH
jgi:hypothetical protein